MKFVKFNKGFSLVEMMVSVAIFSIISGIVVFNSSKFSSNLLITNLAYEVALAVRQAQVYGLSVKGTEGLFNAGYGAHFSMTGVDGNKTFYFFFDSEDPEGKCGPIGSLDCSAPEAKEVHTISGGIIISKLCVVSSGTNYCTNDQNVSFDSMDITFKRPNPNANIVAFINGAVSQLNGNPSPPLLSSITSARIYLQSPQGKQKYVEVLSTGQISIGDVQ